MIQRAQVTFKSQSQADRFPALWRRPDGTLLLLYNEIVGKTRFDWDRQCHVIMASDDDGRSWREVDRINQRTRDQEQASVCDFYRFSKLNDGRLILNGPVRYPGRGGCGQQGPAWLESHDDGKTWSDLIELHVDPPGSVNGMYRPRQLPDGTLGAPGILFGEADGKKNSPRHELICKQTFCVSEDGGRHWTVRSTLYDGQYFPFCLGENDFAIDDAGCLRLFTREDLGYGSGIEFISDDLGYTWTARPQRFMGHHIAVDRLPGGRGLMAVYRVCHYRAPAAVGAWWDDGSTFGQHCHIDQIAWIGRYGADVSQWVASEDGKFLVAYAIAPQAKYNQDVLVYVARFGLDDFRSVATTEAVIDPRGNSKA